MLNKKQINIFYSDDQTPSSYTDVISQQPMINPIIFLVNGKNEGIYDKYAFDMFQQRENCHFYKNPLSGEKYTSVEKYKIEIKENTDLRKKITQFFKNQGFDICDNDILAHMKKLFAQATKGDISIFSNNTLIDISYNGEYLIETAIKNRQYKFCVEYLKFWAKYFDQMIRNSSVKVGDKENLHQLLKEPGSIFCERLELGLIAIANDKLEKEPVAMAEVFLKAITKTQGRNFSLNKLYSKATNPDTKILNLHVPSLSMIKKTMSPLRMLELLAKLFRIQPKKQQNSDWLNNSFSEIHNVWKQRFDIKIKGCASEIIISSVFIKRWNEKNLDGNKIYLLFDISYRQFNHSIFPLYTFSLGNKTNKVRTKFINEEQAIFNDLRENLVNIRLTRRANQTIS